MMIRIAAACVLAACSLAVVGCEDKAKSVATTAVNTGKEALEKAQKEVLDKFDMTKLTEAIGKLSGDAKTTAETKLADFKKMIEDFKAAPMDKLDEWKEKLMAAFEELKKLAGL